MGGVLTKQFVVLGEQFLLVADGPAEEEVDIIGVEIC
jgi:hypothetical protein